MATFGWVAAGVDPPWQWDLRRVGWRLAEGGEPGSGAPEYPLLTEFGAVRDFRPRRERMIVLGVDRAEERARLLAEGFADALCGTVGLAELGLFEAIGALVRLWQQAHPDVVIKTSISPLLGETGETADLTIYRTVQEALTNVFRHAGATIVDVMVGPAERTSGLKPGGHGCALVQVHDNGRGLKPDHKLGLGLTGMRERIVALGGTLTVASSDAGVRVEAIVPIGRRAIG